MKLYHGLSFFTTINATVAYLRDVVNAEGWRQLVSVREGDLVGGFLQGDLCPQEETVPQCVPV